MKPLENISQEIEDLREQLLSLDEEIWGSVEHRDTKALHAYLPLKEKINERIKTFQNAANDLLETIAELPKLQLPSELPETKAVQETVAPLHRNFVFTKPTAFLIDGERIGPTNSWRSLWQTFLTTFLEKYPEEFNQHLVQSPCIAGVRDTGDDLQDPFLCSSKWFECGLSANAICARIMRILIHAKMDTGRVKIVLHGKPDLKGTIFDETADLALNP